MRMRYLFILSTLFAFVLSSCENKKSNNYSSDSDWPEGISRTWAGSNYWANRLQDWQLEKGRMECITSQPNRNLNLLTYKLENYEGVFAMEVKTGLLTDSLPVSEHNWAGFRIGSRGQFDDYRDDAIYGKGLDMGITTGGDLFIGKPSNKLNGNAKALIPHLKKGLILRSMLSQSEGVYKLELLAIEASSGKVLAGIEEMDIPVQQLYGSIALVSNIQGLKRNNETPSVWFSNWKAEGSRLGYYPQREFGPVLFSLYTLSRGVMKMTAQMPPLGENDNKKLELQLIEDGKWKTVAETEIESFSSTAAFRIKDWDNTKDHKYRLAYKLNMGEAGSKTHEYTGTIRKEPLEKEEVIVAGFTGNNDLGFPNTDIFKQVKYQNPDLLFFSGDQIYEGVGGFSVQRGPLGKARLDYLRKWYLFGWEYGDLTRERPTVCLMDDHDVYHGNVWGEAGKAAKGKNQTAMQDAGGYKMPAKWVKMAEKCQTSHMPDPYDPAPVEQGIGVYYTELNYGGVSFGIVEDRKFKSAPAPLMPEAKVNNGWPQNLEWDAIKDGDPKEAVLLGQRQLDFMEEWAADWSNGTWMKSLLSATIFANIATLPASEHHDANVPRLRILKKGEYAPDDKVVKDMDSNGWPKSGRDRAVRKLRKAFAFHIAGDQHLGSYSRYGLDTWGDAGYAFCVPAISNIWPRRWFPPEESDARIEGQPAYTGNFTDGFGNKISVYAVSNPEFTGKEPSRLHDRATGYGIIRFKRESRDIVSECWPRGADPSLGDSEQYDGWPVTVKQMDNYSPEAVAWLPAIELSGMQDPVIRVFKDEELVYAIRIKGNKFSPAVYEEGTYRLEVGDPDLDKWKVFKELQSASTKDSGELSVEF